MAKKKATSKSTKPEVSPESQDLSLEVELTFKKVSQNSEVQTVFDYNIDAFSDSPDFNWGIDEIKQEMKEGWELYAAYLGKEVIAAIFLKKEKQGLLSKNTAVKIHHQGSGHSHQIKEFIEKRARSLKVKHIYHYCRIDNFRMYSLNEKHGYRKTDKKLGEGGQVVEWVKDL